MLVGNQIQQALPSPPGSASPTSSRTAPEARELAEATSANPDALARLLRALASVGIFIALDDGRVRA